MSEFGMDGLSESDDNSSTTSTSSSSSSSDNWPKYEHDTPFLAVFYEDGELTVRSNPVDIEITYRQYSKESEMKKWSEPDELVEYWIADWRFKSDSHNYEKETGNSLLEDLRESPMETLERLENIQWGTGVTTPEQTCPVCDEPLSVEADYIRVQGKRVCPDHSTQELCESGVLGIHTSKEITDNQGDTVRETPDTANRRWE